MSSYANIINAVKNSGQQNISTIKKPTTINNDDRIRAFTHITTPDSQRIPTMFATDIGLQCAFVTTNKVKLMTVPSLVGNSVIGFSLSDDPSHLSPTKMSVPDATQFFLAIVPQDLAATHNLSTLAADPLTLNPLPNGPQAADRLHPDWYDAADPATIPVLAWIPKVIKLPYDHKVKDGTVVAGLDTNSLSTPQDSFQFLWIIAMSTLQTLNSGNSFHFHTTLFDTTDLLMDANNSPPATSRANTMFFDPTDIVPLLHGIDNDYQTIVTTVQGAILSSIIAQGGTTILGQATNGITNPPPTVVRTETERKNKEIGDKRAKLWQHFLACPTTDANGNRTFYFPDLNDCFLNVLAATTVTEAMDLLIHHSHNFNSTHKKMIGQGILANSTFRFGSHLSSPLVRMIQTCAFNQRNLNLEPNHILTSLNNFALLTPKVATPDYEAIIEGSATVMREIAVGVDPSRQQLMPSKLYLGGKVSTPEDFIAQAANMIYLNMIALKNPLTDKPLVNQYLEDHSSITRLPGYKEAIASRSANPYVIAYLVNDSGEMVSIFARAANSPSLATDNPNMTEVTAIFDQAIEFCDKKIADLETTLINADFQKYGVLPAFYPFLPGATNLTGNTHQNSSAPASSPPRKKGKHEHTNNSSTPRTNNVNSNNSGSPNNNTRNIGSGNRGNISSVSQYGLIKPINKPGNWLPRIPANITGRQAGDTSAKKICPAFVLVGASCVNQQSCNLLHISNRNFKDSLDQTAQTSFINWVETTPDVEWSNPNTAPRRTG